jgi:hypothetical protein
MTVPSSVAAARIRASIVLKPMRQEDCLALYFMTIMAPWSVTTTESHAVLSTIRDVFLVFLVMALLASSRSRFSDRSRFLHAVSLATFFGIGTALAFFSGAISLFGFSDVAAMLLTLVGCLALSVGAERLDVRRFLWPVVLFSVFVMVFSIQTGGMTLGLPIRLELTFAESDYTLSGAAFWGLSVIFSLSLMSIERNVIIKSALALFSGFGVLAAASFGARGESVALLAVVCMFLFRRSKILFALTFGVFIVLIKIGIDSGIVEEFTLYTRLLEVQGGYYGLRDQLLSDAGSMLAVKPVCLMTGCGFAYFQIFHGYPYSFYVHNQLVEMIIVFGVPLTLGFLSLVAIGAWRMRRLPIFDRCFVYLMVFAGLTALKSGSIEGSLLLVPLCFFCIVNAVGRSTALVDGIATIPLASAGR